MPRLFPKSERYSGGLTRVDLLVIVAVLGVLLYVMSPVLIDFRTADVAKKVAAKNDEQQIVTAVRAFYSEYGKNPVLSRSSDVTFGIYPANDLLFDVLRNNTSNPENKELVEKLNPRKIVFLEIQNVKDPAHPKAGVAPNGFPNAGVWYDPWGSPYNVRINLDATGKLLNPYKDAPGGGTIKQLVISWSFGKNGGLGGGPAMQPGFATESGTADFYQSSGDVISWQ